MKENWRGSVRNWLAFAMNAVLVKRIKKASIE